MIAFSSFKLFSSYSYSPASLLEVFLQVFSSPSLLRTLLGLIGTTTGGVRDEQSALLHTLDEFVGRRFVFEVSSSILGQNTRTERYYGAFVAYSASGIRECVSKE